MPSTGIYLSDETLKAVKERADAETRGKASAWMADAIESCLKISEKRTSSGDPDCLLHLYREFYPARAQQMEKSLKGVDQALLLTKMLESAADAIEEATRTQGGALDFDFDRPYEVLSALNQKTKNLHEIIQQRIQERKK